MPKDTKTLGNNKARACESLGFAHKKRLCQRFDTTSFTIHITTTTLLLHRNLTQQPDLLQIRIIVLVNTVFGNHHQYIIIRDHIITLHTGIMGQAVCHQSLWVIGIIDLQTIVTKEKRTVIDSQSFRFSYCIGNYRLGTFHLTDINNNQLIEGLSAVST